MSNSYSKNLSLPKNNEHSFAPFIRILGKGKTGSRSLNRQEAKSAMQMILEGGTTDAQLGAFLMLLRVKEESAEELAGFVEASRLFINAPNQLQVDLDWSSYAGKKKQLPWFLLCCFLLVKQGVKIFMHGASGHTAGRLYTETVLNSLNIPVAKNWDDVELQIQSTKFSFLPLSNLCPPLQSIINLRDELGLRSPVHTLSRLINPLAAPYSMQSVFHPAYSNTHQQAALLLGQPNAAVFKGEGGEIERKPEATCLVKEISDNIAGEELWGKSIDGRQANNSELNVRDMIDLWDGTTDNKYAELSVIGTTAIVVKLLKKVTTQTEAMNMAQAMWNERDKGQLL